MHVVFFAAAWVALEKCRLFSKATARAGVTQCSPPPSVGTGTEHCIVTSAPVAVKETSMQVAPVRLVKY